MATHLRRDPHLALRITYRCVDLDGFAQYIERLLIAQLDREEAPQLFAGCCAAPAMPKPIQISDKPSPPSSIRRPAANKVSRAGRMSRSGRWETAYKMRRSTRLPATAAI